MGDKAEATYHGAELCDCGIAKAVHERQAEMGLPVTHTWDMDGRAE